MIFALGKANLRPALAAKLRIEPILAAKPPTIVVTGQERKRSISKIANPEKTSPPGELMNIVIAPMNTTSK